MPNNALQGLTNAMPPEAHKFAPIVEPLQWSYFPQEPQHDCLVDRLVEAQANYMSQFYETYAPGPLES